MPESDLSGDLDICWSDILFSDEVFRGSRPVFAFLFCR